MQRVLNVLGIRVSCVKMAEQREKQFGAADSSGPKETCILWGPDHPRKKELLDMCQTLCHNTTR